MEEEASPAAWLGEPGQSLMAAALDGPDGEAFLADAARHRPEEPHAWHHLICCCAAYGSAPLLDAVLDKAPANCFQTFQLAGADADAGAPMNDACFVLIVDRVWLPNIDGLTALRIANVVLSPCAIARVAEIIRKSTVLQQLALANCALDGEAAHDLWLAVLDSKCPLSQLCLRLNPIGGAVARASAGGRYPKKLAELDLSRTGLTGADASTLARALGAWKTLKVLNLEGNDIGDDAGALLLGMAMDHPTLDTLNLENCSLASGSVAAFVKLVGKVNGVRCLALGDNDFSTLPESIGTALQGNHSLQALSLCNAQLTTAGVNHLLRGLVGSHCTLLMLDLSNNGLASLDASPLEKNTRLEDLNLEGNPLSTATYKTLGTALGANSALQWLLLDIDSDDEASVRYLTEGLARNRSLTELRLQGTRNLTDDQMRALVEAVDGHPNLNVMYIPYELIDGQEMHRLLEALIRNNLALTDVMGSNFDWYPHSGAPPPIDRYLARNHIAENEDLITALHKVIEKSVVLIGFKKMLPELLKLIARIWLGRSRAKSVEALRGALRLRQVNRALGSLPMPNLDRRL